MSANCISGTIGTCVDSISVTVCATLWGVLPYRGAFYQYFPCMFVGMVLLHTRVVTASLEEQAALLNASWASRLDWQDDTEACQWIGVTCTDASVTSM